MTKRTSAPRPRRTTPKTAADKGTSKLDALVALLRSPNGASIDELATATAWQKHSVRGALAGTLKKKDSEAAVTEAELNAALDPRRMTEPDKA